MTTIHHNELRFRMPAQEGVGERGQPLTKESFGNVFGDEEALQKLLPKLVGPFILQPLRGGKSGSGKWNRGSSTPSRQR
jgi:hypothetical protein